MYVVAGLGQQHWLIFQRVQTFVYRQLAASSSLVTSNDTKEHDPEIHKYILIYIIHIRAGADMIMYAIVYYAQFLN